MIAVGLYGLAVIDGVRVPVVRDRVGGPWRPLLPVVGGGR